MHSLACIGHLELHLELVTFLLGLINLFIKFDDHLGMQAIRNSLALLHFNIAVLALLFSGVPLSQLLFELLVLFNEVMVGFSELLKTPLSFILTILANDCLHGAVKRALHIHRLCGKERLQFLLAFGCHVLGNFVRLDHLVRNLIEACLQLAKLLHEKQFQALQVLLLFSHTEGQLFVVLIQNFLFECHLACQLVSQGDELWIDFEVDEDACDLFFKLSLQSFFLCL